MFIYFLFINCKYTHFTHLSQNVEKRIILATKTLAHIHVYISIRNLVIHIMHYQFIKSD